MESVELIILLIAAVLISLLFRWRKSQTAGLGSMICRNCGYIGESKTVTKGSLLIEIALWLCFIVPGLIYSLWRVTTRYSACPTCHNPTMIPIDSPIGKKLAAEIKDESRKNNLMHQ